MSLLRDHSNISFTVWIVLTTLVWLLFKFQPHLAELVYGNAIYPVIRFLYDHTIGLLPWPSVYILLPLWLLYLFGFLHRSRNGKGRLWSFFKRVLIVVGCFYWLWAFNYMRPSLKSKLGIHIPEVNEEELICFFEHHCQAAQVLASERKDPSVKQANTRAIQAEVSEWFNANGLPAYGNPQLRSLRPAGVLLGISTAGIFFPYSLEPHIDAGLHPITQPVTGAHEMGHAFGITDEGECNYIGAAVCLQSAEEAIRYSAHVQIIRWTFYPLLRLGYRADDLRLLIGPSVLADIKSIRERHDSFPEYFPYEWRNMIYNTYLKAQGVESGLESYGEVLGMLMADYLEETAR